MFKRILIANRGEIALRILRACREMDIETVAVFSEADRGSAYLDLANETYCIGPPRAADSYLKIDRVISAAEIGNVQAIHPGYGFLAENAHFADVCRSCQIGFIGPTPEAMALVGDKNAARSKAREAGVPTVPGSEGLINDEDHAVAVARQIGYPVLIKASAGGGGRGMRVAVSEQVVEDGLPAGKGRGGSGLRLRRRLPGRVRRASPAHRGADPGRHAGQRGPLWERDCTMQRRHQKLVEESPAPNLDPQVRRSICESAVRLVKSAGYTNAGTVEFIVDRQGHYYFIEVNARIQVEHPVSEMVTGIDLIKAQIRVAAGEPLPFRQEDIACQRRGPGMPHQRGRPLQGLPPLAGHDPAADRPRRVRRPLRLARPRRLHRRPLLRLDDRQVDRPPAHPAGSHRLHEAGPAGVADRRHPDDHSPPPGDPQPPGIHRTPGGYDVHRTDVAE